MVSKIILTLCFSLTSLILLGQSTKPVIIRVAKGHVDIAGQLYHDRIYMNQLEFNVETKVIFKRKNEAKKFKLASDIPFPTLLTDTMATNALEQIEDLSALDSCKTPNKNIFYKIDFIYCEKYLTYIRTFEINQNSISNSTNMNALEKIISIYVDLTIKNK